MLRIRELRERTGKTMKAVAQDLGVKYTTYITYEKGIYEPNIAMLKRLAAYFHVSVSELVDGRKPPIPMTLEEISKKLGYDVVIVKEEK